MVPPHNIIPWQMTPNEAGELKGHSPSEDALLNEIASVHSGDLPDWELHTLFDIDIGCHSFK